MWTPEAKYNQMITSHQIHGHLEYMVKVRIPKLKRANNLSQARECERSIEIIKQLRQELTKEKLKTIDLEQRAEELISQNRWNP